MVDIPRPQRGWKYLVFNLFIYLISSVRRDVKHGLLNMISAQIIKTSDMGSRYALRDFHTKLKALLLPKKKEHFPSRSIMIHFMGETYPQSTDPRLDRDTELEVAANTGIVEFNTDSPSTHASITNPVSIKNLSYINDSLAIENIKNFLRRPYLVQSGVLSSSDTATTFANKSWHVPLDNTFYSNKVDGSFLIKATLVVTLNVNANRFQTGRYLLYWIPDGGIDSTSSNGLDWINMHEYSLTERTQLHHVEIDINCDKTAVLRIPWHSSNTGYLIGGQGYNSPGVVRLGPYEALASTAGSTTAAYALYYSYEDVELIGATIPQSNLDIIDRETKQQGPIEKGLKMGADVGKALSTIPLLSSVAAPVSWVLDAASKAAHSWGWSKPIVLSEANRVTRNTYPYMANSDGHDTSEQMALMSGNHVDMASGFAGTDLDEMSIDYLKRIPAFISRDVWLSSQTKGTTVKTFYLTPRRGEVALSDGAISTTSTAPVAFLGRIFRFYSGSLAFTFKFIKSEFHTGRIGISFVPEEGATNIPTFNEFNASYTHSEIIDISQGNEFTFVIPFVSRTPWRETGQDSGRYGTIYLYVVDPISAPATVAADIPILTELSGGEDLKFSAPRTLQLVPVKPSAPQCDLDLGEREYTYPQSRLVMCERSNKVLGGGDLPKKSLDPAAYCQGESIESLRQVYKRGSIVTSDLFSPSADQYAKIIPFYYSVHYSDGVSLTGTPTKDYYTYFSCMYALSRGGVRLKTLYTHNRGENAGVWNLTYNAEGDTASNSFCTFFTSTISNFVSTFSSASWLYSVLRTGGPSVQIPQALATHSRVCAAQKGTAAQNMSYTDNPSDRTVLRFQQTPTATANVSPFLIHRAGADDGNFGLFVSTVPLVQPS